MDCRLLYTRKRHVRFKVTVDDLFFNIDTAIPCGLIITELATNSFKHAFPKQAEGEIAIELHRKDDMFHLSVRDNGVGLPHGFRPREDTIVRASAHTYAGKTTRGNCGDEIRSRYRNKYRI